MSFFDEADEDPQLAPRTQPHRTRSAPRTSGGRGGGRPPRHDPHQKSVQNRRLVLVAAVVVAVILIALLVHGCESSQTTNSLKSYSNNVSQLITASDQNGRRLWSSLESGKGSATLSNEIGQELYTARGQLSTAEGLSVPGAMSAAQQNLLMVMTERRDGIHEIAANIQGALDSQTSRDSIYAMTAGTALLYSSDVIYKNYVTTEIAEALHGDGITVCPVGSGSNCADGAVAINPGQIVNDLGWLQQSFIAAKLGSKLPTADINGHQRGLHGDAINANATTADGIALSTSAATSVKQSGGVSFKLSVTNGGHFAQDPTCRVTVDGITATSSTGRIDAGQTGSCTVKLPKQVPAGTFTVVATVEKVYGETNLLNNSAQYSVTFS